MVVVAQNSFRAIDSHLRKGPCHAFVTDCDVKLTPGTDEIVYIPDVICIHATKVNGTGNGFPIRSLSWKSFPPSTAPIDRKEKAVNYRRTPSMEEYVIASQKRAELTIYRRAARWLPEIVSGMGAVAEFRSLGISVPLSVIYEDVLYVSR